ncbi:DUF5675 family protein [Carboxylicivirga sp. M1479]|uniref:DUF5675 family protein n=1 Tax=Carboxylicivirga sp. M1479 TaxID=2594476 RepID=UPI001178695F|nr:DUF5675 family protein [Carboxylicivirga sp. M1479]TRX72574.1 hypothetical protein FNN09_01150 [Carboxylicivirga sp. M1479]
MELKVVRYSSSEESTLGLLLIDGVFACYTLEDEHRDVKVAGETRIPAGRYRIQLRTFGGHHWRYMKRYGAEFHKGMLQIMDVPGFTDILIHKGNDDDDTAGCLLVGDSATNNQVKDGFIGSSTVAYNRIYPVVRDTILKGSEVFIEMRDEILKKRH